MKKNKSLDGYELYSIVKENKELFLANKDNYKKDIDNLIENLDELKFDSLIIVFGLDTGSYIEELEKYLCGENKVIIFEPNEEIFWQFKDNELNENISIILFDSENIEDILLSLINGDNFDNLYVHAFGNYKNIYLEEYEELIEKIDTIYFSILGNVTLSYRCKESFMKNSIDNLSAIENSTPLAFYKDYNKNIPAIVVSAGPSLDKNIKDMIENKEDMEKCLIIACNRTFSTLIKNGIRPDVVVAIDPSEAIYDMMKDNINEKDIPLVFYEYSNRKLVKNYKGEKIYSSGVLSIILDEMRDYCGLSQGGSVAHSCVSFATTLGCNPIILVGQDFAYTNNKHHSDNASFDIDKTFNTFTDVDVEDVFGNKVKTTLTLNMFRKSMEHQIVHYKEKYKTKFFNASYGANIEGTIHKELKDILDNESLNNNKKRLLPNKQLNINKKKVIKDILEFIDIFIEKSEQGIEQCTILKELESDKSLVYSPEDDIDFQRFLFVFDIVNTFESSLESFYLGGYFSKFLYAIKRNSFSMLAKDYDKFTSSIKYQGSAFLNYFIQMKEMLIDAKNTILEVL